MMIKMENENDDWDKEQQKEGVLTLENIVFQASIPGHDLKANDNIMVGDTLFGILDINEEKFTFKWKKTARIMCPECGSSKLKFISESNIRCEDCPHIGTLLHSPSKSDS